MAQQVTLSSRSPLVVPSLSSFWIPVRNLLLTISLTAVSFTIFGYFWKDRGFELLVVGMGWAHVTLGFLFFFGRVARKEAGSKELFLFLSFLAVVLLSLHYWINLTFFIFIFFLFHAFRDEVAIYLQTRDKTRAPASVYALNGFFPILLLALFMFQPQDFRQLIRRVSVQSSQMNVSGWTLLPFEPVEGSANTTFHFNIQAPESKGHSGYFTSMVTEDRFPGGEIRLGDRRTDYAKDLVFVPQYADDRSVPADLQEIASVSKPLDMAGNNRIGQTFVAERDGLSGIWISTAFAESAKPDLRFNFKLDSPPLFPLEYPWTLVRKIAMMLIGLWFLWQISKASREDLGAWLYMGIFFFSVLIYQQLVRPSSNAGYLMPNGIIFVVLHYFSWYVFSYSKFSKIKKAKTPESSSRVIGNYDRFLGYMRNPVYFTLLMVGLNVISFAGVFWYHLAGGPDVLKYAFNGEFFLFVLLFHVTFSINPTRLFGWDKKSTLQAA